MANRPTISIVMAVYNQREYLPKAIDSVLAQTTDDWELVIIDDGSDDGTKEYLQTISDPKIRMFRFSRNTGKPHCLNEALRRCSGQYLLELDSDDWLDSDAIAQMLEITGNWPTGAGFVYGNVRLHMQRRTGSVPLRVVKGKDYPNKHQFLLDCDFFAPRLWRKQAVEAVGGWPTAGSKVRDAHQMAIQIMSEYGFAYRDFTVYNYRKHNSSLRSKLGRGSWEGKKEDITRALQLWSSPYTPFFDDLMHLVFLRPNPVSPEPPAPVQEEEASDADEVTDQQQEVPPEPPRKPTRTATRPHNRPTPHPSFAREVILDPIAPEPSEEPDAAPPASAEPVQEVTGDAQAEKVKQPRPLPRLTEIHSGEPEPAIPVHGDSAPSSGEFGPIPRNIPRANAVHWPAQSGLRVGNQDFTPPQPTAFRNIMGRNSRAQDTSIDSGTVAFLPIATAGGTNSDAAAQTKYSILLARYLAQVLGGAVLPSQVEFRESQQSGAFTATYSESPSFIRNQIRKATASLAPRVKQLVVVPGIPTARAAQLITSALSANGSAPSFAVVNASEVLGSMGLSRNQILNWAQQSIEFLEHALGTNASEVKEADDDLAPYFKRIAERVRTHLRLATKRTEIRLMAQEGELGESNDKQPD